MISAGLYTILGFEPAIFTSGESILNSFSGGFSALELSSIRFHRSRQRLVKPSVRAGVIRKYT